MVANIDTAMCFCLSFSSPSFTFLSIFIISRYYFTFPEIGPELFCRPHQLYTEIAALTS